MDPEESKVLNFQYAHWPELRLYEQEEHQARSERSHLITSTCEEGLASVTLCPPEHHSAEESSAVNDPDYFRYYHMYRFFMTIQGFLQGDLDLTGRHQHRLDRLKPLWKQFFEDFHALKKCARVSVIEYQDHDGQIEPGLFYDIGKDDWTSFRLKWRIPRVIHFDDLVVEADCLSKYYLLYQDGPKIQRLCLLDLPVEILDHICSVMLLRDARLFSASCKRLYTIGRQYIFQKLVLGVRRPRSSETRRLYASDSADSVDHPLKILPSLALEARQDFIEACQNFQSQPSKAGWTRKLSFRNSWRTFTHNTDGSLSSDILDPTSFYSPILPALVQTLGVVRNLQILELSDLDLTSECFVAISQLSFLRNVILSRCIQTENLTDAIIGDVVQLPRSPQVKLLDLGLYSLEHDQSEDGLTWLILLIFPTLTTLHCANPPHDRLNTPLIPVALFENLPSSLELFTTIQTLFLTHFHDIPFFADMFRLSGAVFNRSGSPLPLTHLKIHSCWGQSDEVYMDLLAALHSGSARLKALILEGLQTAGLALFDCITEYFPDLVALGLVRRENARQHTYKACPWPHPTWEYARYCSRFRKLKHFSWNSRFNADMLPAMLLVFERQAKLAVFHSSTELAQILEMDTELRALEEEAECGKYDTYGMNVARLFSVHCPTLETFGDGYRTWGGICISKDEKGRARIESEFPQRYWWNPRVDTM
ncbi:hypothetical protein F5051DRAFT_454574 [Lentinula edodes]|nr:hypothetical protein F5051DRAFT_454574 [Lentinula edodes]